MVAPRFCSIEIISVWFLIGVFMKEYYLFAIATTLALLTLFFAFNVAIADARETSDE
jgi:hypothetical protein